MTGSQQRLALLMACLLAGAWAEIISSQAWADLPPLGNPLLGLERARYAQDFGYLVHDLPAVVFCPNTTEGVAQVVKWAFDHRVPMATRGTGHSAQGQSQSETAVVDMSCGMNQILDIDPVAGTIRVQAGITWGEVSGALATLGYRAKGETSTKLLSVGGTLSIGGGGAFAAIDGMSVHNVRELRMVVRRGLVYTANNRRSKRRFKVARGGQGQAGIIAEVVLNIERIPSTLRAFTALYTTQAEAFAATLDHNLGRTNIESAFCTAIVNSEAGLAALGELWTQLGDVTQAFQDPYVHVCVLVDMDGDFEPPLDSIIFPMGETALEAYLAVAFNDQAQVQTAMTTGYYYTPRSILHMIIPLDNMTDATVLAPILSTFANNLAANPTTTVTLAAYPAEKVQGDAVTPFPYGGQVDALGVSFIMTIPVADAARGMSAGALAREMELYYQEMWDTIRAVRPDTKLYPYGFRPDGYSWEEHYGDNWDMIRFIRGNSNPRRVLGRGVDIFDPRA